ncbi:MAG: radical SAM protein, partial [Planctomycetes bacterium]|nr:radical SAM protein [Planctomycetota bacterium]
MQGLYVHIPFCVRKCGYCDFYSEVGSEDEAQRFLDAIEAELALRANEFAPLQPKTVFFGGGTPTKLTAPQLVRLGEILHRHVDLSAVVEWTSEINPGTLDGAKAEALVQMGVNRASFGVQSFSPHYLEILDRA